MTTWMHILAEDEGGIQIPGYGEIADPNNMDWNDLSVSVIVSARYGHDLEHISEKAKSSVSAFFTRIGRPCSPGEVTTGKVWSTETKTRSGVPEYDVHSTLKVERKFVARHASAILNKYRFFTYDGRMYTHPDLVLRSRQY